MMRSLKIKISLQLIPILFLSIRLFSQEEVKFDKGENVNFHSFLKKASKHGLEKRFDSASYYMKKASLIADNKGKEVIAYANIYQAKLLYWEANTERAKEILNKNIKTQIPLSDTIVIHTHLLWGEIYLYEKNYPKALIQYINAEKILMNKPLRRKKDSLGVFVAYDKMGFIHNKLSNKNKAKKYFKKALNFVSSANMKSYVLFKISNLYKEEKNKRRALMYLKEATTIASKNKWQLMLPTYYSELSNHYIEKKDGDSAIYYAKKGLHNNTYCRLNWLNDNMAKGYLIKKNTDKAIEYFNKALKYTTSEETLAIHGNLRDVYEEKKQYQKALVQNKLYLQLKDSLNDLKVKQEITDITEKYESDKKELKIEILNEKDENNKLVIKKQQFKLLLFGVLLISSLCILVIIFFNYKKQEKHKHLLYTKNRALAQKLTAREKPKKEKEIVIEKLKKNEIYNAILKLIATDFYLDKEVTLSKTAKKLNTNTTYLSKIINESYKKSFSSFINELRVSFILKKIETSADYRKLTIDHIADIAGFTSSNAFYRAFKKITGLTPSYYIKKRVEQG